MGALTWGLKATLRNLRTILCNCAWPRGSTGVQRYGRDPSKIGSSKFLVFKSFSGQGTLWDSSLPVSLTLWDTPALSAPPLPLPQCALLWPGQGAGSVDPRFLAGLPFPVPQILEFVAFRDPGNFFQQFSRNFPGVFLENPRTDPGKQPQPSRVFYLFCISGFWVGCWASTLVAPYRAILRYYCCDTPYRAILFKEG